MVFNKQSRAVAESFAAPTSLYRYIALRLSAKPLFLQRNLSYLPEKRPFHTRRRSDFSWDDFVAQQRARQPDEMPPGLILALHFHAVAFVDGEKKSKRRRVSSPSTCELKVSVGSDPYSNRNFRNRAPAQVQLSRENEADAVSHGPAGVGVELPIVAHSSRQSPSTTHFPCAMFSMTKALAKKPIHLRMMVDLPSPDESENLEKTAEIDLKVASDEGFVFKSGAYDMILSTEDSVGAARVSFYAVWVDENGDRVEPVYPFSAVAQLTNAPVTPSAAALNTKLFYKFWYRERLGNGKIVITCKKTESEAALKCPWCLLDCCSLKGLLQHCRCYHSRFVFDYEYDGETSVINVQVSKFSWSEEKSFHLPIGNIMQRTPFFLWRKAALSGQAPTITEFELKTRFNESLMAKCSSSSESEYESDNDMETDSNKSGRLNVVTGKGSIVSRKRSVFKTNKFYHSTAVQILEDEFYDESDVDDGWFRKQNDMMLDDITDINNGERDIMKLWNSWVMDYGRYGIIADCQLVEASIAFVHRFKEVLVSKNLRNNVVLHLLNMRKSHLLSNEGLIAIVRALNEVFPLPPRM